VVVVGTFSKSFSMTGWRVGYVLADAEICRHAVKVQDAMIICAPVISQVAVEGALRQSWRYPVSFHPQFLERRRALVEGIASIPRLRWTPTRGAFFGFVRVDGADDSDALARDILERAHVVTIPGAAFGRCGEGHLRMSYGSASAEAVREATVRLKQYFEVTGGSGRVP
jgi:aminotransferase